MWHLIFYHIRKHTQNSKTWKLPNSERKKSIWFYINEENENEKVISSQTWNVLEKAFGDPTQPKLFYFPELKPTPRKRDITFLSYVPQSKESLLGEINSLKLKGGSKQKYLYNPNVITKNNEKRKASDKGRKR